MQLQELISSSNSLQYASGLKLPALKSFRVSSYLKSCQNHLDAWTAVQKEQVAEHSDGKGNFLSDEHKDAYQKALNEVLQSEVDVAPSMILSYPADFKADKLIPIHVAVLSDMFVSLEDREAPATATVRRGQLLEAYIACQGIAQQELPRAVADVLIYNLVALRTTLKSLHAADVEAGRTEADQQALLGEEVEVPYYPINVALFGDHEIEPGAIVQAYWLLTGE